MNPHSGPTTPSGLVLNDTSADQCFGSPRKSCAWHKEGKKRKEKKSQAMPGDTGLKQEDITGSSKFSVGRVITAKYIILQL